MAVSFNETMERMLSAGRLKNMSALAGILGVTPQTISNYKKRGEISADIVLKFARVYGLSVDWLVYGTLPVNEPYLPGFMEVSPEEKAAIGKLVKVMRSGSAAVRLCVMACIDAAEPQS